MTPKDAHHRLKILQFFARHGLEAAYDSSGKGCPDKRLIGCGSRGGKEMRHDEYTVLPCRSSFCIIFHTAEGFCRGLQRQHNTHLGVLPLLRVDLDGPTVTHHDVAGQGQP